MGNSGGKVPQYEVVDHHQQASTSETPRPSAGSFSPPSQGLVRPSSPSRQQWAPVQQAPPPPLPNGWDFHIDPASGYPYFYNTRTGVSQWQDPRGPGFALPDRSDGTNLGQRRQVIPPWEGGPVAADPLSWPLPPGWQEQQDQATNQRYFVNYDARILSYNDPRMEIAKAYAQGPVVQGVPVHYPPPVIGRPVDEIPRPTEYGQFGPPPVARPPSGQGGTSYLPPPPLKKRKHSLWSKLGYRHTKGRQGLAGFGAGLLPGVFLLGNPIIPGGHDGSSSSSTSSDNDDDNSDVGDDLEAGGDSGEFSLFSKGKASGSGDDTTVAETGDDDLDVPGDEGDQDSDSSDGGSQEDWEALRQYGHERHNPPGGSGGGTGGVGDSSMFPGSMEDGASGSGAYQQSLFGAWRPQIRDMDFQGWDNTPKGSSEAKTLDTYTKIIIVLTIVVGSYIGVFEGVLSLLIAFAGRFLILMWKKGKMLRRHQIRSGHKFRGIARWVSSKWGSKGFQLKRAAISQCTQMQAWYYEHVYEHPLVRMRILTEKDAASPLYSKLHSRPREITIVTQASADRLPAIEAMAKSWGGVLCIAIYVRTQAELQEVYPRLCSLHERIEARGHCRLNICVAREEGVQFDKKAMAALYPVNAMRNVALSMAITELVFILDADFVPSVGMHELLTGDEAAYSEILRMATIERQMLVVPAFEGISPKIESLDVSQITFPTEMCELREQWKGGSAKAFHCAHFPRGHMPTNYEGFFNPSTLKPYSVQYREFYEPYTICARNAIPSFDARFRGYGLNKISHAYHCAKIGMKFSILPNVFVWSLPHLKSQAWMYTFGGNKDPLQKLRIFGLYRRFKSELQMLHGSVKKRMEETSLSGQLEIIVKVDEPLLACQSAHINNSSSIYGFL